MTAVCCYMLCAVFTPCRSAAKHGQTEPSSEDWCQVREEGREGGREGRRGGREEEEGEEREERRGKREGGKRG